MKATISLLFIYVIVSSINIINAINIDYLIALQQKHIHRKETRINQLTQAFHSASDLKEQHKICSKIIDEYLHFNADSALVYGIKGAQISSRLDSSVHQQFFLSLSQAFIHSGFIHKAENFLQFYRSLNDSTIDFAAYYQVQLDLFESYNAYDLPNEISKQHSFFIQAYRDSLISVLPENSVQTVVLASQNLIEAGHSHQALQTLTKYEDRVETSNIHYGDLLFLLAKAHRETGNLKKYAHYLKQAAEYNMMQGNRDNPALHHLALLFHENNQIEKAYKTMKLAYENALQGRIKINN